LAQRRSHIEQHLSVDGAAKALGLIIPPSLLLWADQVIEGKFTDVEYL
jgi:hypothetical protein